CVYQTSAQAAHTDLDAAMACSGGSLDPCRSGTIPGRTGPPEVPPMSRPLLIFAVLTSLARTVSAAPIDVDRLDDSTAIAATTCSAAPGDCSLRGAILKANGGGGGDTIMLPAGTYNLTIANGVAPEDAAMTGDLDITKSVTITGAGSSTTFIDAS